MVATFHKAVKSQSYLRMALAGPSGAGKTWTALALATTLAGDKPVAVIDTERGSASLYSDLFPFDVIELDTFHPDRYIEAIQAAQDAGYGALVIDSLTHAWEGKGGLLEVVEGIAKRSYGGNTFRAWAEGTPIQNRLIDALTSARLHIIATMRTKSDYAMDKDERTGKTAPRKVGMAVKQRDGVEYEFDIFGKLTLDNELIVEKSRCPELAGQIIPKPGHEMAETLLRWLSSGEAATPDTSPPAAATAQATARPGKPAQSAKGPAAEWTTGSGYNPLSDRDLMERFMALGATTMDKVEAALAKVKGRGEYTRDTILAYVTALEKARGVTRDTAVTSDDLREAAIAGPGVN